MLEPVPPLLASTENIPLVKCVVWDLDNTLWDGVLLEEEQVSLREGVVELLAELDWRGILNSIASKNDAALAMAQLEKFGIEHYFLFPQIHWSAKSASIQTIASSLNLGLDSFLFIDDQPFERDEVSCTLPEVRCLSPVELSGLLDRPELRPRFITPESRLRRQMYLSDHERSKAEANFVGPAEDFLASLKMVCRIRPATVEDLQRAEELTVRTHQLNATGYTYSYEELDAFRSSDDHLLLVVGLEDVYGPYGTIGLALVTQQRTHWCIKLLLVSCRVMSRGIGSALITYIMHRAHEAGVRLHAEFLPTSRNRMMYVTYKFAGFKEMERQGELLLLEHDLSNVPLWPAYIKLQAG